VAFLVSLATILILVSGCRKSTDLVVSSPGLPDRKIELRQTGTFSLSYTHSVEKTPVIEVFQVQENGTLLLTATKYKSYGVGLPSLPEEGRLTIADGWFVLDDLRREYREIRLRVGPEARLSLEIGREIIPLYKWYPPGSLVIIRQEL
jgi:hypothetical protein